MSRSCHSPFPRSLRASVGGAFAALALAGLVNGAQAEDWPSLALPQGIKAFDIGSDMSVNGLPIRVRGFVSLSRPGELAHWFRQSLGQPLLESTVDNKLILGRMQGEHYLTVQLEPAGTGTRGLVGITHVRAAADARAESRADAERWISRWPAGSRVLSQVVSHDAGRVSRHAIVVNAHSRAMNAERIKDLMAEDGLTFERAGAPVEPASVGLPVHLAGSQALFFKGAGKEAIATIHRDGLGRTSIVLNTITRVEGFR